jgi:hypothetical protein
MTSAADHDPQRNCHMCYSENERDRDPPPPPPNHHHHHYVGSLAKDVSTPPICQLILLDAAYFEFINNL